ncbi:hypothetical protein IGI04_005428 [Brassica rapa subsp. trilocularis]|uniref:BAH domain-containing protein n=1 Tax=Brassica rapa subsp. trilocularis TaxID=1813537 RepID=A0ABQ7NH62_BRACM|nr:hypothetical protein IGI04_005428 [Brassica rapa subsp. trilocularis]
MVSRRRFAQVSPSNDEEDFVAETRSQAQNSRRPEETMEGRRRKRRNVILYEESDEEEKETERKRKKDDEETPPKEVKPDVVKPVGEPVKITGRGNGRRTHYRQFECNGKRYELEESVMMNPEGNILNPYIAIIKDITQKQDGRMMILGQWFYRQEEAKKKGGGHWEANGTRELFYSFHRDEVPAESVMHRCPVNFVPPHKKLPKKKGFIVRKVYDTDDMELRELTDKVYEDARQHEIDLFVEKSVLRLGDLPDLETEDEDVEKAKGSFQKVNITPVDVRKEEDNFASSSEYHSILQKFDSLTDNAHRNKCLAKLLEAVRNICSNAGDEANVGSDVLKDESFIWPDAAVHPVCALEMALNVSLASDHSKYNQRIRSLVFNLKNTALLARRLLNGQLEPEKILNMSPTELKEGLTNEETEKNEPDDAERMQMTDVRCLRCSQIKVCLSDIFQTGHGDRYQLECIACGNSWYASRDEISILDVDTEQPARGRCSEAIEKNLTSPREAEKKVTEHSLKTTNESNADNNPEATKKPE